MSSDPPMLSICERACLGELEIIPWTPANLRLVTKTLLPIATNRIWISASLAFF